MKDIISTTWQKFNSPSGDYHEYVGYTYDNDTKCTKNTPCRSTYTGSETFTNSNGGTSSDIKKYLEQWYYTDLKDKDSQIAYGTYCNDTTYRAYKRLDTDKKPSLKCPDTNETYGGLYKLKIGLLTADEMNIAGLPWISDVNSNYYMYHDYSWWTMSPYSASSYGASEFLGYDGYISSGNVNGTNTALPVINLNSDVQITGGDGTESNPYIVD